MDTTGFSRVEIQLELIMLKLMNHAAEAGGIQ